MHKNWSGYGIENLISEISQSKMSKETILQFNIEEFYDNIIDEFVTKNIALVGESAHSIDPSGFQKPTIAFEDAFVLAKCLSNSENESIEISLKNFEKLRNVESKILDQYSKSLSNEYSKDTGRFKKYFRILRFLSYKTLWFKIRLNNMFKRSSI